MEEKSSTHQQLQHHIILVHGLGHGAWCWYKVMTMLKSEGHRVTVPDLAASGIDLRRLGEEVSSFSDYSQPLMDIMASLPPHEKVILVGHSLGGLNIAMAMERFPHKVAAAVFVTAFMPDCTSNPSSVLDKLFQMSATESYEFWMDTKFNTVSAPPAEPRFTSILFGPQFMSSKLYQLCPPEDLVLANTLVRPGSFFREDLQRLPPFSKDRYGSVPCAYIKCPEDAGISNDMQQEMIEKNDCNIKEVIEIEGADHMAMLSKPLELFKSLSSIANNAAYAHSS